MRGFIVIDLEGDRWSVMSYRTDILRRAAPVLPSAPVISAPVTGLWLAATFSFGDWRCIRWEGTSWSLFRNRGEGSTDRSEAEGRRAR